MKQKRLRSEIRRSDEVLVNVIFRVTSLKIMRSIPTGYSLSSINFPCVNAIHSRAA